jgi:hypothetical protein
MPNRYSVLLKFLENLNSHLIFEFEGKKNYCSYLKAIGSSTVVEHLSHHPKVEGSNPAATAGSGREEMARMNVTIQQSPRPYF